MATVGFLSPELHSWGGLELFEIDIAEALHDRGWSIVSVHDARGNLVPRWQRVAELHERSTLTVPLDSRSDANPLRSVDVLYVHSPDHFPIAVRAGAALSVPVVAHLHLPPFHLRPGIRGLIKGRQRGHLDPIAFGAQTRIDRFIAVSDFTAGQWIKTGLPQSRFVTIPNGVDLDRFHPPAPSERSEIRAELGVPSGTAAIGYIGRIAPEKGIEQLLDAFGQVRDRATRPVALLVAGAATRVDDRAGGTFAGDLTATEPADVRWLGKRDDVERLYRGLDLVVVPSQWEEPFGLVTVEAMASGVPVISTGRGGLPEILGGGMRANVVRTSPRSLARRIDELVVDPDALAWMGTEARRHAERHFNIADRADQVDEVLRSVKFAGATPATVRRGARAMLAEASRGISNKLRYGRRLAPLYYRARVLAHLGSHRQSPLEPRDEPIVGELKREAAVVTTLDELDLGANAGLRRAAEAVLPTLPDRADHVPVGDPLQGRDTSLHCFSLDPPDMVNRYPEILLWGLDERLLDIIERYIGLPVAFTTVHLRKDIGGGDQVGTRIWHLDTEDQRVVRIVLYLNDVTLDNGPFEYISLADTKALPALHERGYRAAGDPILDDEMAQHVPPSRWRPCPGPAGTVVIADNAVLFHHGRPHDGERLALIYTYTSRKPRYPELHRNPIFDAQLTPRQRSAFFVQT
jgi:glycosyltransferase involved in cell wall biosynthesis